MLKKTQAILVAAVLALGVTTVSVEAETPAITSPAPCFVFNYNLMVGSSGVDVAELQNRLITDGNLVMPAGVAKGYFGNLTRQALASWQLAHNVAPAIGYFGPITRAKINSMDCGHSQVQSSVQVMIPNDGEVWQDHATANIVWNNIFPVCNNCGAPAPSFYQRPVDIYLQPHGIQCFTTPCTQPSPFVLDKNVTRANNTYGWIVATDIDDKPIPAGKYKVQVCVAGSTTDCDESDGYFDIISR